MKFNYENTYKLMKAYRRISPRQAKIIDFLWDVEDYEFTYSSLAKQMNLDAPNVRKSLYALEELGIIHIVRKYKEDESKYKNGANPMIACFLVDGWMDILLNKNL